MFRLAKTDELYSYPVSVEVPADGGPERQVFHARFRLIEDGEIDRLLAKSPQELLKRAIGGWSEVYGENGEELPFDEANLAKLCRIAYFRRATVDAYVRFAAGLPEKNSETPPASG